LAKCLARGETHCLTVSVPGLVNRKCQTKKPQLEYSSISVLLISSSVVNQHVSVSFTSWQEGDRVILNLLGGNSSFSNLKLLSCQCSL